MDILYPVTAFYRNDYTRLLYSEAELLAFCKEQHWNVGPEWYYPPSCYSPWPERPLAASLLAKTRVLSWILRDDLGRPVDPRDLPNSSKHNQYFYYYPYFSKRKDVIHAMEKGLPIPGSRKRKRRKGKHGPYSGGKIRDARYRNYGYEENMKENDDG